jgi:ribosomal protein S18 acetylase RimI-like enzyme
VVTIRPARPADALAVAVMHLRSSQEAHGSLIGDGHVDPTTVEERAARYTFDDPGPDRPSTLLATDGTPIVGLVTTGPAGDDDRPGRGEVYALYVDPDAWGTGVGRALMAAGRDQLVANGHTAAVLWVLAGNERAIRFYQAAGWVDDGVEVPHQMWGAPVTLRRFSTTL